MTNWFLNKAEEIKNESVYDLVQDFVFSVVFIVMIAIFLSRVPAVAVNNIDFSIQVFFLLLIGFWPSSILTMFIVYYQIDYAITRCDLEN